LRRIPDENHDLSLAPFIGPIHDHSAHSVWPARSRESNRVIIAAVLNKSCDADSQHRHQGEAESDCQTADDDPVDALCARLLG